MSKTKFAGLFDEPPRGAQAKKGAAKRRASPAPAPAPAEKSPQTRAAGAQAGRGRPAGRAGGKRSDPEYTAITAYVRRGTLADVKARLAREPEKDMSDIVQAAFERYASEGGG